MNSEHEPERTRIKFAVYFEEDGYSEAAKGRLVKETAAMIRQTALECYNASLSTMGGATGFDATTLSAAKETDLTDNGEPVWFCLSLYVDPLGNTPTPALVHIGRRQWITEVHKKCNLDITAMSQRN
jgi:hypothetical protein